MTHGSGVTLSHPVLEDVGHMPTDRVIVARLGVRLDERYIGVVAVAVVCERLKVSCAGAMFCCDSGQQTARIQDHSSCHVCMNLTPKYSMIVN